MSLDADLAAVSATGAIGKLVIGDVNKLVDRAGTTHVGLGRDATNPGHGRREPAADGGVGAPATKPNLRRRPSGVVRVARDRKPTLAAGLDPVDATSRHDDELVGRGDPIRLITPAKIREPFIAGNW